MTSKTGDGVTTLAERVERGREQAKVEARQERAVRKDLLGRIEEILRENDALKGGHFSPDL